MGSLLLNRGSNFILFVLMLFPKMDWEEWKDWNLFMGQWEYFYSSILFALLVIRLIVVYALMLRTEGVILFCLYESNKMW